MNILTKLLRVLWIGEYRGTFLRTRVVASTEHDRILAGLQLNTVVDVGANRGQFALCIRRLYPHVQIFCRTAAQTCTCLDAQFRY